MFVTDTFETCEPLKVPWHVCNEYTDEYVLKEYSVGSAYTCVSCKNTFYSQMQHVFCRECGKKLVVGSSETRTGREYSSKPVQPKFGYLVLLDRLLGWRCCNIFYDEYKESL